MIKKFKDFINESKSESFAIPPKIKKNYRTSGDLSNVGEWKAKIILNNSATEDTKVGDWDEIGYVGISSIDNQIIPIARADEHQNGHELIWHLYNDGLIKHDHFITIFSSGKNFIWHKKDIPLYVEILNRYAKYGGNTKKPIKVVEGDIEYDSIDDFLNDHSKSGVVKKESQLNILGKRFIDEIEDIGKEYVAIEKSRNDNSINEFIVSITMFIDENETILNRLGVPKNRTVGCYEKLRNAMKKKDYVDAAFIIFGFPGIKNDIHNNLRVFRKYEDGSKKVGSDKDLYIIYKQFFGSIKVAFEKFEYLGNIT